MKTCNNDLMRLNQHDLSPLTQTFCRAVGSVREELEPAGVSGPAGSAVLQVRTEQRPSGSVPPADGSDEGSGLRHSAR